MNVPTPIHAPTLNYHSNNHSSIKGDQTSMSDDMRSSQNQEEKSLCLPGFNERSEFDLTLMPPGVDDLDRILNPMPPGKKTLFYQASAEHGGGTRLAGKSRARPGERKEWKDEIEKIDREDYGYDSTYPTG
jgi:hypothetical protein